VRSGDEFDASVHDLEGSLGMFGFEPRRCLPSLKKAVETSATAYRPLQTHCAPRWKPAALDLLRPATKFQI
jgi:hypothetical protein